MLKDALPAWVSSSLNACDIEGPPEHFRDARARDARELEPSGRGERIESRPEIGGAGSRESGLEHFETFLGHGEKIAAYHDATDDECRGSAPVAVMAAARWRGIRRGIRRGLGDSLEFGIDADELAALGLANSAKPHEPASQAARAW
jgi:hypothetical protein